LDDNIVLYYIISWHEILNNSQPINRRICASLDCQKGYVFFCNPECFCRNAKMLKDCSDRRGSPVTEFHWKHIIMGSRTKVVPLGYATALI
ncbi:hypothetical protein T08_11319, partial [Trichinella sp. T8]